MCCPLSPKRMLLMRQQALWKWVAQKGGVLLPFLQKGCSCVGVDLAEGRVEQAKEFLIDYVQQAKATLVAQNIYDEDFVDKYQGSFDIIILKDVIEHVPEQGKFIPHLTRFLRPGGQIFFGFPPLAHAIWWTPTNL
jgi:2-polyprenyl-3-methyl-5-hydroxy-6-metoxy-1,4-benzoquinol methylase